MTKQNLIEAIQFLYPKRDIAMGVRQYLVSKGQKLSSIMEWIQATLNSGQIESTTVPDAQPIVLSTDAGSHYTVADFGALKESIALYLEKTYLTEEDVLLEVYTDGQTSSMTMAEALDRISDQYSLCTALTESLAAVTDFADAKFDSIFDALSVKLRGSGVKDDIVNNMVSGIDSLVAQLPSYSSVNAFAIIPGLLGMFGLSSGGTAITSATIGHYEGVSPFQVVLYDACVDVGTFIIMWPTIWGNMWKTIGKAIVAGFQGLFEGYYNWITPAINTMLGWNDGLRVYGGGDGSIDVSYSYRYPASVGSWQVQYIWNAFVSLHTNAITGLSPFGIWQATLASDESYVDLCFIPKLVNPYVIQGCLKSAFGTNLARKDNFVPGYAYDGKFIVSEVDNSFGATYDQVIKFFQLLGEHQSEIFTIPKTFNDAEKIEGIYWAQFMACLCAELMSSDPDNWDDNVGGTFETMTHDIRIGLFQRWANYPGWSTYPQAAGCFEPKNFHFGILACSMCGESTAWSVHQADSANSITFSIPSVRGASLITAFAILMHDAWGASSVTEGLGYFTPYVASIKSPAPSYYIPSDEENVAWASGIMKRGLIVAAAIVIAVAAVVIFRKMRYSAFTLAAKAGSLSWSAADSGDNSSMRSAFALQKRANLLSRIVGGVQSTVGSGVSYVGTSGQISKLAKVIDPNSSI